MVKLLGAPLVPFVEDVTQKPNVVPRFGLSWRNHVVLAGRGPIILQDMDQLPAQYATLAGMARTHWAEKKMDVPLNWDIITKEVWDMILFPLPLPVTETHVHLAGKVDGQDRHVRHLGGKDLIFLPYSGVEDFVVNPQEPPVCL